MKIEISEIPVGELKPNPWNTNIVTPENELKIEESLKRFGMFRPIVARTLPNGTREILGGEHRWTVARRLGYDTVPVIDLGEISDTRAKEIGLVDNGRYGEDDTFALSELLKDIGSDDAMSFLPYTGDELENIFASSSIALNDLDIPDGGETLPELPAAKATQTHQVMRFKVPVGDADFVQRLIDVTMKNQGFTKEDSMSNAGNALVHLLKDLK